MYLYPKMTHCLCVLGPVLQCSVWCSMRARVSCGVGVLKLSQSSPQSKTYSIYHYTHLNSYRTLEAVQSVNMPDQVGKVYKMERGEQGVWITFRKTTLVCLYDTDYYIKLLQLDYTALLPSPRGPVDPKVSTRPTHTPPTPPPHTHTLYTPHPPHTHTGPTTTARDAYNVNTL